MGVKVREQFLSAPVMALAVKREFGLTLTSEHDTEESLSSIFNETIFPLSSSLKERVLVIISMVGASITSEMLKLNSTEASRPVFTVKVSSPSPLNSGLGATLILQSKLDALPPGKGEGVPRVTRSFEEVTDNFVQLIVESLSEIVTVTNCSPSSSLKLNEGLWREMVGASSTSEMEKLNSFESDFPLSTVKVSLPLPSVSLIGFRERLQEDDVMGIKMGSNRFVEPETLTCEQFMFLSSTSETVTTNGFASSSSVKEMDFVLRSIWGASSTGVTVRLKGDVTSKSFLKTTLKFSLPC
jgi:hypothetical protein